MNKDNKYEPLHPIHTKEMQAMGFDLMDLESKSGKRYDSSVAHRHTFFELFLFTGGNGIHEIDFHHYPALKNTVHFVSPGQIHKLTLRNTKGYVFCFTEDFSLIRPKERFIEKFSFYDNAAQPVLELNSALGAEIVTLTNFMKQEFNAGQKDSTDALRSYLNIILLKIQALFLSDKKNVQQTEKNKKLAAFKDLIENFYAHHKPVADYAEQLHVSPNYLNALCRRHDGRTAIQLIHARLLLEAKRLLYATDMSIKEISFYLNFEDVAYFNRFFKKHTQLTPNEYRIQSQEKSLKSTRP